MNRNLNLNSSVSSINDYMGESSGQIEDPLMRDMKAKIAQIQAKYPVNQEEKKSIQQSSDSFQKSANNTNSKFEVQKGTQKNVKFDLTNQSSDKAYSLTDSGKQKQFIQKMEKKLQVEESKLNQKQKQNTSFSSNNNKKVSGNQNNNNLNKLEHDKLVKDILKQHEKKIETLQQQDESMFIKETLQKIKPKKTEYVFQEKLEEREKQWQDIRHQPFSAGNVDKKGPDNKKNAVEASKSVKSVISGDQKSKKSGGGDKDKNSEKSWKYQVGEGVKTEKQKEEEKKQQELKNKLPPPPTDVLNKSQQKSTGAVVKKGLGDQGKTQKDKEKNQLMQQMEYEKQLQKQAKKMTQEGENNLKKPNKALKAMVDVLDPNVPDPKQEREKEMQRKQQQLVDERNELDQEEINRLKVEMRQALDEQKQLKEVLKEVGQKKEFYTDEVNVKMKHQNVIILGEGLFAPLSGVVSQKAESLLDTESSSVLGDVNTKSFMGEEDAANLSNETAAERIVRQIEKNGLTLQKVYLLLDSDGDGVLLNQEISDNIGKIGLDLSESDEIEFMKIIDKNGDGVVTEQEFVKYIQDETSKLKDYDALMGNLKNVQPIELEERKLDLETRKKVILKKIEFEKKQEQKKKGKYDSVFQQLLKEEQLNEKREKMKKKPNIQQLQQTISKLKTELRLKEDEKDKLDNMQKERMYEIEENVEELTRNLMEQSELVIQYKSMFRELNDENQKIQLQQIAMEKIKQRIEDDHKQREMEIQTKKQRENTKIQLQEYEKRAESTLTIQQQTQQILTIKKIVNKWRQRVKKSKERRKLKFHIRLLGRYFLSKKKVALVNDFVGVFKTKFYQERIMEGLLRLKRNMMEAENDYSHKESKKKKYQSLATMKVKLNMVFEPSPQTNLEKSQGELALLQQELEDNQDNQMTGDVQILYQTKKGLTPQQKTIVTLIQKYYHNVIAKKSKNTTLVDNQDRQVKRQQQKCDVCVGKDEDKRVVDLICQNCYKSYCMKCFKDNHKNFKMSKHVITVLNNDIPKETNIMESKGKKEENIKEQKTRILEQLRPKLKEIELSLTHEDAFSNQFLIFSRIKKIIVEQIPVLKTNVQFWDDMVQLTREKYKVQYNLVQAKILDKALIQEFQQNEKKEQKDCYIQYNEFLGDLIFISQEQQLIQDDKE